MNRMLASLLAAVALALGGCGNEEPAGTSGGTPGSVAEPTGSETGTPSKAKESGKQVVEDAKEAMQETGAAVEEAAKEAVEETKAAAEQVVAGISAGVRQAAEQYLKDLGATSELLGGIKTQFDAATASPKIKSLIDSVKASFKTLDGAPEGEKTSLRSEFGGRFADAASRFTAEAERIVNANFPALAPVLDSVPLFK